MDWMLPGVAPTGRRVESPLVAIVRFRDDKVAHEHIYGDQASVLVQLGLLPSDGLPVVGIDTARKVLDPTVPTNRHFGKGQSRRWIAPARPARALSAPDLAYRP